MIDGGANMYLLHLAGYKAKLVLPDEIQSKPSQALLNIQWAEAYILQEKTKLNLETYPGMKRMIDHLQSDKQSNDFPPFSLFAYLTNEDCLDFLSKKQINAFSRRVASLYRICYQKHPQRSQCVLTGKRANHYTEEDLVIIEQAFDTLDVVN